MQQRRQSFLDFMAACRGGNIAPAQDGKGADTFAEDIDNVTLACVQGWREGLEADEGTWWHTLAQQVPPGILLLFLLATLGVLYRYNLRLAGFHHGRADALELLAQRGAFHAETLETVAAALSADRVEMGRAARAPADQAIDMARAIMARK
ncbi:hypothetical protein AIOL_000767 [Candidatus Rhodobacter oscarellae]|uniref:Uncharacterized protein n=2 Tax=Candidatus Rhodobacter oscarellae TaxID=1675527 RepID=A0A0J9H4M9_9RHOB|nr:hypothetical protein AIOL_000767 [Candidatus Rhodobacter lobularis]